MYEINEQNNSKIPSKEEAIQANRNFLNQDTTGKSAYVRARAAERSELHNAFKTAYPNDDVAFIGYIPNAKFPWANAVFRDAKKDGRINPCDRALLTTLWMKPEQLESMKSFVNKKFVDDKSVQPHLMYPNKSGLTPVCGDDGQLKYNLKNPGMFNMYTGQIEEYPTNFDMWKASNDYMNKSKYRPIPDADQSMMSDFSDLIPQNCQSHKNTNDMIRCWEKMNSTTKSLINKALDEQQNEDVEQLSLLMLDKKYLKLIMDLKNNLTSHSTTIEELNNIIGDLNKLTQNQRTLYASSLLFPWSSKTARIPNVVPVPSATFSLASNVNLTTNILGNVAFSLSPAVLFDSVNPNYSSLGINNNATLTGTAFSDFFLAVNIGQSMPANFYVRYRLVSAGIRITYTAPSFTTGGYCTMSVSYNSTAANAVPLPLAYGANGDFSRIENGQFKSTMAAQQGAKNELIYLPPDEDYTKYVPINTTTPVAYQFNGYITGAPPSTNVARLDYIANYETIVDNAYTDYIPTSSYGLHQEDLSKTYRTVSTISESNDMSTERRSKLANDLAISDQSNSVRTKIRLPKTTNEIKKSKGILDYAGDIFTDLAKTAISTFLPIGGNLVKDLIFPSSLKTNYGSSITVDDFPDVPQNLILSKTASDRIPDFAFI